MMMIAGPFKEDFFQHCLLFQLDRSKYSIIWVACICVSCQHNPFHYKFTMIL